MNEISLNLDDYGDEYNTQNEMYMELYDKYLNLSRKSREDTFKYKSIIRGLNIIINNNATSSN